MLAAQCPDATLAFTVHLKDEELCYAIVEHYGQLCLSSGRPIANVHAHHWSFTVFKSTIGKTIPCGTVDVHQKAAADLGPEFAERVGRQLVAIAGRRD